MLPFFAWLTLSVTLSTPPHTLVVCPAEFRGALGPWEAYRQQQGHEIAVIAPPASAAELRSTIRRVASLGKLKYVVLVGDVPMDRDSASARRLTIPTNY